MEQRRARRSGEGLLGNPLSWALHQNLQQVTIGKRNTGTIIPPGLFICTSLLTQPAQPMVMGLQTGVSMIALSCTSRKISA